MKIEMKEFGIRQRLYQGVGCIQKIPDILAREGWSRVMIIAGPNLYKNKVIEPIETLVKQTGAEYIVFTNIRPNPEAETIEKEAIPAFKTFKPDVIVAVGGGSPLDTAKGVVIVGDSDRKVLDFTIDKVRPDEQFSHKMPALIAIPTTAGTGSEVGKNAVISDPSGLKLVLTHESIQPQYALMDPEMLAGLPFSVAAATTMDAFVQALETLTNRNANDFTRTLSLRALELIGECIRPFVSNPADPDSANKMSLACMYAGFSLGLAGIGQDHVITHPMSEAPFYIPHGDACGMVLPAVIEYNGLACKDLYRKAYNALTGKHLSPNRFEVQMLIDWCVALNGDLHIAGDKSFEEWGYNDGDILELMLRHPIVQFAVEVNAPKGETEYPRTTSLEAYRDLIKRVNVYSKAQAEKAKAKFATA
jgi:alcohol dehydrogenase class IV